MKKLITILLSTGLAAMTFAQSATTTSSSATKADASFTGSVKQHASDTATWINNKADQFTGGMSIAGESSYIYRGKQWAHTSVQPSFVLGHPLWLGTAYAKAWMNFPVEPKGTLYPSGLLTDSSVFSLNGLNQARPGTEIDITVGYKFPLPMAEEMFSVDLGYTYYWFPSSNLYHQDYSNEMYLGLLANVLFNPALYGYYDWNRDQFVLEGSVFYKYDLGNVGLHQFFLDASAKIGLLSSYSYRGNHRYTSNPAYAGGWSEPEWENGYFYGQITLALGYMINEKTEISLNVNYSANRDGKGNFYGLPANIGQHEQFLWWGLQASYGF